MDFACGSGSLLLNVRKRMGPHGIGKIFGQEKNITTYNLARMNNISRYVSTAKDEVSIDLAATHREFVDIERQILESTAKHNAFLRELGLPPLP